MFHLLFAFVGTTAFSPLSLNSRHTSRLIRRPISSPISPPFSLTPPDGGEENFEYEIFDYENAPYAIDQGGYDEFPLPDGVEPTDEEAIEAMRESRRERNDQFQFETFWGLVGGGDEWKGRWEVVDVAHDGSGSPPTLSPRKKQIYVTSRVRREEKDGTFDMSKGSRLLREETVVSDPKGDNEHLRDTDEERGADMTSIPSAAADLSEFTPSPFPSLEQLDFRGEAGNMVVANAYTVCSTVPEGNDGPLKSFNVELGLVYGEIRLRLRLHYAAKGDCGDLLLGTVVMCRDRRDRWPSERERAFMGPAGAPGGLYDPPPIGEEDQTKYMLVEFDGYTSSLFPYVISQAEDVDGENSHRGVVASIDWSPGRMRYQVDRKMQFGRHVKHLRTLELSEVQVDDAERLRPKNPDDMRQ